MRISKWDNLKFLLIWFVVLGHFIGMLKTDSFFLRGLQFFIYTFHMPAFLFVSGLFSKRTVDERKFERVIPYFVLYIFMKVFRFLVGFLTRGTAPGFDLFTETGVPWFALTLFLCYLVTMAVSRLNHRYLLIVAVSIGIMAGYDKNLGGFLTGMRLFTLYPFFLAGYCVPIKGLTDFIDKRLVKVLSGSVLLMVLVCSYVLQSRIYDNLNFLKGKSNYEALGLWPYGGIYRGAYYVTAMMLILCVTAVVPSVSCVFTRWGKRTIQVFALHYPVMGVLVNQLHLKRYLKMLLPGYYVYLIPVIALILTVALSAGFMEPFFDWLMRPKTKENKIKG